MNRKQKTRLSAWARLRNVADNYIIAMVLVAMAGAVAVAVEVKGHPLPTEGMLVVITAGCLIITGFVAAVSAQMVYWPVAMALTGAMAFFLTWPLHLYAAVAVAMALVVVLGSLAGRYEELASRY